MFTFNYLQCWNCSNFRFRNTVQPSLKLKGDHGELQRSRQTTWPKLSGRRLTHTTEPFSRIWWAGHHVITAVYLFLGLILYTFSCKHFGWNVWILCFPFGLILKWILKCNFFFIFNVATWVRLFSQKTNFQWFHWSYLNCKTV